jgi:hypothetical protein
VHSHPNFPKDFIQALNTGSKRKISANLVTHMSQDLTDTIMLSTPLIFKALSNHPDFKKFLPDETFPKMNEWLLSFVNGYSGGELESLLQNLEIERDKVQDSMKKSRSFPLKLV